MARELLKGFVIRDPRTLRTLTNAPRSILWKKSEKRCMSQNHTGILPLQLISSSATEIHVPATTLLLSFEADVIA